MWVDDVGPANRTANLCKSKGGKKMFLYNTHHHIMNRNVVFDLCSQCWKSCFYPVLRNGRKRPLCPRTRAWLAPIHTPARAADGASAHGCVCGAGSSRGSVIQYILKTQFTTGFNRPCTIVNINKWTFAKNHITSHRRRRCTHWKNAKKQELSCWSKRYQNSKKLI